MLSFVLVPLHTATMGTDTYGELSVVYAWFGLFNVILAYGMETAFFRFINKNENKAGVISTSLISLLVSSLLFLSMGMLFKMPLASLLELKESLVIYVVIILTLDALAIIPFARLRALERPVRYSVVKVVTVGINLALNSFFLLLLPKWAVNLPNSYWATLYIPNFQLQYVLVANVLSSGLALIWVGGIYFDIRYRFDKFLWKQLMNYALPVMLAGIAFAINEVFDRILLAKLLDESIAKQEIGKYSACYKLAVFMTLFGTAFRLGVEPFFFSHAQSENPQKTYAQITTYFVVMGSTVFLAVMAFIDPLKELLVQNEAYWEALNIVPLILLAGFCLGIYHNFSVWYKITDRTRFGAYISALGAMLTLVINGMFIPKIGYMASAWATLVAYGSMMCLSYFLGQKHYPIPYNVRKLLFYAGLSITLSLLSFFVFDRNILVGSLFLFLFLALVYKLEGNR